MRSEAQLALRAQAWTSTADVEPSELGAVYTPPILAEWVASELTSAIGARARIWDIACGDGALLDEVSRTRRGHRLVGVDVDRAALVRAQQVVPRAKLYWRDALSGGGIDDPINELVAELGHRPDAIILNPPWGASLALSGAAYRGLGYELAVGQFDSYDLFVELSLGLLRPGGVAALILPDSLLNAEHLPLRRLLLERTTLELVARLGEGFFPSVYRGVMVLLVRNQPPPTSHRTRCFRLPPTDRKRVLADQESLGAIASRLTHVTPQSWFARSPQMRIELDVREDERRHLERFEIGDRLVWRDWLLSGRGVELSKHGRILRCPRCDAGLPLPRQPRRVRCRLCRHDFRSTEVIPQCIVEELDVASSTTGDWRPLIVGEDVRRYSASASRVLRVGVPGIAYKSASTFDGEKLLIRKTGVGLNAAVDRSGALTTQVVFHYKMVDLTRCEFMLDYLAAVLNSRFMLAYHLRTRGEGEWRSHPYVTQSVIEELPIPSPVGRNRKIAEQIAQESRARASAHSGAPDREIRIERLVSDLYQFDQADWRWALAVLDGAQALEGIKELRIDVPHRLK